MDRLREQLSIRDGGDGAVLTAGALPVLLAVAGDGDAVFGTPDPVGISVCRHGLGSLNARGRWGE